MKIVDEILKKQAITEKNIWEISRNVGDLNKRLDDLQSDIKSLQETFKKDMEDFAANIQTIGMSHFFKKHWWKIGPFLVTLGLILGWLTDLLIRFTVK